MHKSSIITMLWSVSAVSCSGKSDDIVVLDSPKVDTSGIAGSSIYCKHFSSGPRYDTASHAYDELNSHRLSGIIWFLRLLQNHFVPLFTHLFRVNHRSISRTLVSGQLGNRS